MSARNEMRDSFSTRLAAACGALFWIGILVGDDVINGAGEAPNPIDRSDDSLAEVSDYLGSAADASANGSYWIGRGIGILSLIALLVFSAYVARRIRAHERDSGILAGFAFGSGVAAVSLGLSSAAAQFAVVARANAGVDPETARVMLDFSGIAFTLMWLPLAALLAATAVAGMRYAILPRWLSIAAALVSITLVAGLAAMPATPAGYMAIMLASLWFIAAGVALARRDAAIGSTATLAQGEA